MSSIAIIVNLSNHYLPYAGRKVHVKNVNQLFMRPFIWTFWRDRLVDETVFPALSRVFTLWALACSSVEFWCKQCDPMLFADWLSRWAVELPRVICVAVCVIRLVELWDHPKYGCPAKHGSNYYYNHNSGLQNQRYSILRSGTDPISCFCSSSRCFSLFLYFACWSFFLLVSLILTCVQGMYLSSSAF